MSMQIKEGISMESCKEGYKWRKKLFIEKACMCFCKVTCKGYQQTGKCFADWHCEEYNKFRKAIMED